MGNMRFKVDDRVRIKSIDWYNENKDEIGVVKCGDYTFTYPMTKHCGKIVTIKCINTENCYYIISEDDGYRSWTDEMIEGLAEEETVLNKWTGLKVELELSKTVIGVSNVESLHGERFMSGFVKAIIPPEGYQFVDENGNVINATKIVLEKKKKEYPKTYEECHELMVQWKEYDCNPNSELIFCDVPIHDFCKLIVARNIYWKIAGDEMGLEKPWEPTHKDSVFSISRMHGKIVTECHLGGCCIFEFPTPEMRDAFKENFDPNIEICKEFL